MLVEGKGREPNRREGGREGEPLLLDWNKKRTKVGRARKERTDGRRMNEDIKVNWVFSSF